MWKTLKQKCLGPKFEKRYEKEVICLGHNLEVFMFQFWTWSKDGTLLYKKDCAISVGGSLALEGIEELKSAGRTSFYGVWVEVGPVLQNN